MGGSSAGRGEAPPLVLDSVTALGGAARGRVVFAASHGGVYAAYLAARAGVRAVVLNDAGIGRERAGVGGLLYLDGLGVPACAVSHRTARIGRGEDLIEAGVVSEANKTAQALGVRPGQGAREAAVLLAKAPDRSSEAVPETEARAVAAPAGPDGPALVLVDSNSLIRPEEDRGAVVACGSHGGLLGGRPETACKTDVFAVLFNDADRGRDDAGTTRLPALDARGIAAGTVSAWSARIGDGRSTLEDGWVSCLNRRALALGAQVGMAARDWAALMRAASREGR